jgi:hypothetical protein
MVKYFPIIINLRYPSGTAPVLDLEAITKAVDDKGRDMFPAIFFGHVLHFYHVLYFLSNHFPLVPVFSFLFQFLLQSLFSICPNLL